MSQQVKKVAFQGHAGAYSHLAAQTLFPHAAMEACARFDLAFEAVEKGQADAAVIPIENSTAGRVTDIHRILPNTSLKIIAEHFQPIHHCLLMKKGADKEGLTDVWSHPQALMQCEQNILKQGLVPHEKLDTAGAAKAIANGEDVTKAAIASSLAAEIYGLEIAQTPFEDMSGNTTRFVVFAPNEAAVLPEDDCATSFLFKVRNIPASLYKALGGFATNGVNMLKLESYMGQDFTTTMFYADVAGHPEQEALKLALEELSFFTSDIKMLGTYLRNRPEAK